VGWTILTFGVGQGARMMFYSTYMNDCCVTYRHNATRWINFTIGLLVCTLGSMGMLTVFFYQRKGGYSQAFFRTCYLGCFLFGISYISIVATRDLDGDNKHWQSPHDETTSPSIGGRLSVAFFCLIVPPIVYLYRHKLFGLMAKMFEDEQRLKDGAFLAALIADIDPAELMTRGMQRLRRVKITDLDLEVMSQNKSDNATVEKYSEKCAVGDIDFFISHSWSDDPVLKVQAIAEVAAEFRASHGRDAWCWLDKLCIDQTDIANDLQCLPVFVMACKRLLILSGPTYPTRLWCAWEMYVFFAMASDTNKLLLKPLEGSGDTLERLKSFKASEAHCWSAEDEAMLRGIIGDDVKRFESEIHEVASSQSMQEAASGKSSLAKHGAKLEKEIRRVASELQSQQQSPG